MKLNLAHLKLSNIQKLLTGFDGTIKISDAFEWSYESLITDHPKKHTDRSQCEFKP